ncbi:PorT family protein [Aestuariivivens insulae]|uniref:PorT family protein n=1 Tax=Aestuariivivens insulae TaxID=1621988 RepID=UPI001F580718|nr:PorT family protein [Aestuariivivens insulae]
MSDKKHIDRLFQEKFKDFEASPRDEVWDAIEAQLNKKKKKRRVIPIWWRYAGVAALLVLLLTLGGLYFNSEGINVPTNQVVDTESGDEAEHVEHNDENPSSEAIKNQNDNTIIGSKDVIANSETNQTDDSNTKTNGSSTQNTDPAKLIQSTSAQGQNTITSEAIAKERITSEENNSISNPIIQKPDVLKETSQDNNTTIANNKASENEPQNIANNNKSVLDKDKAKNAILNTQNADSLAVAQTNTTDTKEQSIEDLIDKDIKELIEEEKFNRWSVAPNAAPVYFNSLGEGSSIDPQFNTNAKSGELNMSYGIKASYAINKKLRIRSGINKVRLGYNTNDVVVFQSISSNENTISAALPNIDSSTKGNLNTISSSNNTLFASADNFNSKNGSSGLLASAESASINQEFGYIEIPLEIQYTLLDKKFGVNLIGGFSSFFLNENKVFSETSSSRTLVGEANNINNVSYSANLGLGLNYKISKKLDLNVEPLFKYQINTFSNTSGNFKPYFIGVYTGFAIKF